MVRGDPDRTSHVRHRRPLWTNTTKTQVGGWFWYRLSFVISHHDMDKLVYAHSMNMVMIHYIYWYNNSLFFHLSTPERKYGLSVPNEMEISSNIGWIGNVYFLKLPPSRLLLIHTKFVNKPLVSQITFLFFGLLKI